MVETSKTIVAASLIGAVAVGALGGAVYSPVEVTKEVIVEKNVTVPVEMIKYVNNTVEVPVEVIKNVTVEKLVDNGNLSVIEQFIYDNNGDLEFITNDLDDDEVYQIADRIVFANEVKSLAVNAIEKDLFDELDGEAFNASVRFDDKDLERLRVNDDADEVLITDYDYEDGDAKVKVTGSFEQDDVKYDFDAVVKIAEGEYDEIYDINVTLH